MVQKKGYLLKGRVIDGSLNAPIEPGRFGVFRM